MTTRYLVNRTLDGVNGFGSQFCKDTYTVTLAGATEATLTVPGGNVVGALRSSLVGLTRFLAVFSYEEVSEVWVANNETAAVPAGATLAASTSELNPTAKIVKAGDVISIISAGTPDVSIALYSIQD